MEFITYIRDRGFLAGSQFEDTLEAAFSAWESYEWYMCQYLPEHWEEADYVRKMYPCAYADSEAFFGQVKDIEKVEFCQKL